MVKLAICKVQFGESTIVMLLMVKLVPMYSKNMCGLGAYGT